jgi:hypothetical protein
VSTGRRREFRAFSAFAEARARQTIPDPQRFETFAQSRLNWSELDDPAQAAVANLYRALLRWRASLPAGDGSGFDCAVVAAGTLALLRWNEQTAALVIVNLDGSGDAISTEPFCRQHLAADFAWSVTLHTEDPAFALDPMPVAINLDARYPSLSFPRAGAVVFHGGRRTPEGRANLRWEGEPPMGGRTSW